MNTVLVALSHPDDEVGCAGTILAHTRAGDRVVLLWLTRGEMTEIYGDLPRDEVAQRRMVQGREAAALLGAEARFLAMPDTRVHHTPDTVHAVARVIADTAPDAVLTWGDAWVRGMRHPDHQATGRIVRDAITIARIGRAVAPAEPHREPAPLFTLRGRHSTLPSAVVDVSEHVDTILALGAHYRERVGWPEEDWLQDRLRLAGRAHGVGAAETFDAWETPPGLATGLV